MKTKHLQKLSFLFNLFSDDSIMDKGAAFAAPLILSRQSEKETTKDLENLP